MENLYLVLCLSSVSLCFLTCIFSILSYCKVVGMEKSTHKVSYMPIDEAFGSSSDDLARKLADSEKF